MQYTIGQLARLAGISARTLHYYDERGLLKPTSVRPNGYRCYENSDLVKLQQILFFRELDFPLEEIGRMINSPGFDVSEALRDQRRLIELKRARLDALLDSIDATLSSIEEGNDMAAEELYGSFTREQIDEYKQEVRDKWGDRALTQSEERTRGWTAADYSRVEDEGKEIAGTIARLMDRGPADAEVQEQVERYFQHICRFYDCTLEIFRGLGEMYVRDERFAAYFRRIDPGLPGFMREAMACYCSKRETGTDRPES
ncbi:MAG: MerR family transcriptional regulator [Candidatus Geothermincolia bacterium]